MNNNQISNRDVKEITVQQLIKSSRANSRVSWLNIAHVSRTNPSTGFWTPMTGTEMVVDLSAILNDLTQLIARDDLINFCRRGIFRLYKK